MTNRLPQSKSHYITCVAFSLKMTEEALEQPVDGVRVGVLSFNVGQETHQIFCVTVEKDNLNPKLFSYIPPRPLLALKVRKGRVEKK